MKSKIISELKKGLEFPRTRGEVAAQEQLRILKQAIGVQNVQLLWIAENQGEGIEYK